MSEDRDRSRSGAAQTSVAAMPPEPLQAPEEPRSTPWPLHAVDPMASEGEQPGRR
jgi:hypothetical protein